MMDLINKRVAIYYDDKANYGHIAKKDGLCVDDDNWCITIRNASGFLEKIPYRRIIRIIEVPTLGER